MTEAQNVREDAPPQRRVILLGASNLLRGIPTIVELARNLWKEPLEMYVAMGHGRSLGMDNWVLGRTLPGILSCGLWQDLQQRPPAETFVAITDVGNDILYDVPVKHIACWFEECLQRLCPAAQRVVMTELPLESISNLNRGHFFLLRSIFFPRSRLSFEQVISRTKQLNEHLKLLAAQWSVDTVKPQSQWYGWDPIHIKSRRYNDAWREILCVWNSDVEMPPARRTLLKWLYFRSLKPHWRRLFGFQQRQTQPAGIFRDGTTLALY